MHPLCLLWWSRVEDMLYIFHLFVTFSWCVFSAFSWGQDFKMIHKAVILSLMLLIWLSKDLKIDGVDPSWFVFTFDLILCAGKWVSKINNTIWDVYVVIIVVVPWGCCSTDWMWVVFCRKLLYMMDYVVEVNSVEDSAGLKHFLGGEESRLLAQLIKATCSGFESLILMNFPFFLKFAPVDCSKPIVNLYNIQPIGFLKSYYVHI